MGRNIRGAVEASEQVSIKMPLEVNPLSPSASLQLFDDNEYHKKIRRGGWTLFSSIAAIAMSLCVAFAGIYWMYQGNLSRFATIPYVFFEIKAVEVGGHPVAGASVYINGKSVGSTDSFGEWRKFLRLQFGSSVELVMQKKSGEMELSARKNLVIPLRHKIATDPEIKQTIELVGRNPMKQKVESNTKLEEKPHEPENLSQTSPEFSYDRIAVKMKKLNFQKTQNPIGFARQEYLSSKVVPELKTTFIRRGLAIDSESPWSLELQHISVGEGESLILVHATQSENPAQNEVRFLRNYIADPTILAQQIADLLRGLTKKEYQLLHEGKEWYALQPQSAAGFWSMTPNDRLTDANGQIISLAAASPFGQIKRMHVLAKKDPCVNMTDAAGQCFLPAATFDQIPPRPELSKHILELDVALDASSQIFVYGFEARPKSPTLYEYWARTGHSANLSVIRKGRLTLRSKITPIPGRATRLKLSSQTVAIR